MLRTRFASDCRATGTISSPDAISGTMPRYPTSAKDGNGTSRPWTVSIQVHRPSPRAYDREPRPMPIQAQRIRPGRWTARATHAAPADRAIANVAMLEKFLVSTSPPNPVIIQAANRAVVRVTVVITGCRRGRSRR